MPGMIDTNKRLLPVFETPAHLEIYDIQNAAYDVQLSVTTLTGLINRGQPRIYLLSNNDAEGLFNALLVHVPHEYIATDREDTLDAMLKTYRDIVRGMVIYDPAMLDSVNVATTMAGLRDAIVVSPQQAAVLQHKPYQLPVVADLRVYHWKNRLQAYRWAEKNLLKEATKQVVAGLKPTIASGLRSFLVATRAFVYWLNPPGILPDPAAGWISERCEMKRIIRAFPAGTPHMGWLVNEFAGVDMTSKAALYLLPSDYFYNLEVWTAVQPQTINSASEQDGGGKGTDEGSQGGQNQGGEEEDANEGSQGGGKPRPYPATDEVPHPVQGTGGACPRPGNVADERHITPKVYVSFTISDGDNLQYNQHRMYQLWQDTARGSVPLGWTIAPTLIEAAPTLAAYYQNTATQNDELVAGASGAAYIWPSIWPANQQSAYLQTTGTLMQRMDLRTIEVLDGLLSRLFPYRPWQEQYARSLSPFGVRGILVNDSYKRGGWRVVAGVPVIKNLGLAKSVAHTLELIKNNTPAPVQSPTFLNIYVYAWSMTPTDISKVIQGLDTCYEVVTPGQLCALVAQTQEQK
jgi:GxGYxYP putative glycoside hydrolase C-terminal domain/GxGYxY sequence motif in domain of unknown function N-terminal